MLFLVLDVQKLISINNYLTIKYLTFKMLKNSIVDDLNVHLFFIFAICRIQIL